MSLILKGAAAAMAVVASAGSALAGPYVNVENNASRVGNEYQGAVTDFHVGYEGDIGENSGFYVQGGPALVSVQGEENETEFSGKVGASVGLTESLAAYGEISAITDEQTFDDLAVGTKLGLKYNF